MADDRRAGALTVVSADLPGIDTDFLAIPVVEDQRIPEEHRLNVATGGEIARALSTGEFKGKAYEIFLTKVLASGWRARRLALVGAGRRQDFDPARARNLAAAVAVAAQERHVESLAYVPDPVGGDGPVPTAGPDAGLWVQATAEGLVLGHHVGGRYKTTDRPQPTVSRVAIVASGAHQTALGEMLKAVERGAMLGECSNLARELSDEPGGILTPQAFATRAADLVGGSELAIEILDAAAIAKLGMELLLGVARGSHEAPRLLVIRHNPAGVPDSPVLGFVGKGITFDAGGISIKPPLDMARMKDDMAGGAAVVCAMRAIGRLKAPMRVLAVVPCAENMPGGAAIRPGDVLTSASGKTVEVVDTDAEGRLILADALWYAQRQGATHLVDVATLTGACQIALGKTTSGLMGRPTGWVEHVRAVADRVGDRSWILPLFEDYRDQLRSEIADIANVGGRPAGAITAGMFLREFVGDIPWAHMDIAGTAWHDEAKPYAPKGPSGVAVRTLAELAFSRF